jgi:hypothetical protein
MDIKTLRPSLWEHNINKFSKKGKNANELDFGTAAGGAPGLVSELQSRISCMRPSKSHS